MKIQSFAPIAPPHARVLILGSMPGVASLTRNQYYAHPRNTFWPILGDLIGLDPSIGYEARIAQLETAGVALWDVAYRCVRSGSLDSAIARESVEPNDFAWLFERCPLIECVAFNGRTAQTLFEQRVVRTATYRLPGARVLLPSTSPAHAGLALDEKRRRWREAIAHLLAQR